MWKLPSLALSFLAIVIAAGALLVGIPRSAHALAAALVQVANTPSNPAVIQGIGNQAAQIVEVSCGYYAFQSQDLGCSSEPPQGAGIQTTYTVPTGSTLVVTAIDIFSGAAAGSPCASPALAALIITPPGGTEYIGRYYIIPPNVGTEHYAYPTGFRYAAGTTFSDTRNASSACTLAIRMTGYLTTQ